MSNDQYRGAVRRSTQILKHTCQQAGTQNTKVVLRSQDLRRLLEELERLETDRQHYEYWAKAAYGAEDEDWVPDPKDMARRMMDLAQQCR